MKAYFSWIDAHEGVGVYRVELCEECLERAKSGERIPVGACSMSSEFEEYPYHCMSCGVGMEYEWEVKDVIAEIEVEHVDECDCGPTSRHHDGGNYHWAYGKIIIILDENMAKQIEAKLKDHRCKEK